MRTAALPVLLLLLGAAPGATRPQPMPSWMVGAWQSQDGERWSDEYWTPPRGGMMIGAARMGKGDRLTVWEHSRITREADGKLVYWAMPRGAPATRFAQSESTATSVTFVNPGHDYPQRVRYWREGTRLKAEISRLDGTDAVRFDYAPMGRR